MLKIKKNRRTQKYRCAKGFYRSVGCALAFDVFIYWDIVFNLSL
jgi:hypothetical protein